MARSSEKSRVRCSFCGKPAGDVRKLIAGPDVHICDECVTYYYHLLADIESGAVDPKSGVRLPVEDQP